jgi:membrane protein YqaA with SNARE-associated domain
MGELSLFVGAALTCVVSGVLPWINAELVVFGTVLLLPPAAVPPLVIGCALGQMASKAAVYGISRVAPHRLPGRLRLLLSRAERLRERRHTMAAMVLSSALVSLPPFYLVTIACGTMRLPFTLYALLGLLGTTGRYAFLAWLSITMNGS